MAEIFSNLTIVFESEEVTEKIKLGFDLLYCGKYGAADTYFKERGVRTKFVNTLPGVETINSYGAVLNVNSLMDKFNVFSHSFLSKIPNTVAIVQEEYSEYDFKSKTTTYIAGEKTSRKEVSKKLDSLEPCIAFLLSITVSPNEIRKRFRRLDSPTQKINGIPAFWHLSSIIDQDRSARNLFPEGEVNTKSEIGDSVAHYIINTHGNNQDYELDKVFRFLIKFNFDINMTDKSGATPLMLTCSCWRQSWAVKFLLEAGADPNLKDLDGRQAIHYACSSNELNKLVEYLDKAGADLNARCKDGSALWIANKISRKDARYAFSNKSVDLTPGLQAYSGISDKDIYTAIHHGDIDKYEILLSKSDSKNSGVEQLLALACDYQDGSAFFALVEKFKLEPASSDIVNNNSLIDRLNFLYPEHPATGDSVEIGLALIRNDSREGVMSLIESRDFIVNLKKLIRWNPNRSVKFFQSMKDLGIEIGAIKFNTGLHLLHRLAKDLEEDKEQNRSYFTLEEFFHSLVELRRLGVVFSKGDIRELRESGIHEDKLSLLN